jgi:hypothetical protein
MIGFMWNNELISGITIGAAATVPIIVAIVQVVKMTGKVQDKYAPVIAIVAGIGMSMLIGHTVNPWNTNVLAGVLYGLAASGLYSGVKTTAHAIKADRHKIELQDKYKHK